MIYVSVNKMDIFKDALRVCFVLIVAIGLIFMCALVTDGCTPPNSTSQLKKCIHVCFSEVKIVPYNTEGCK